MPPDAYYDTLQQHYQSLGVPLHLLRTDTEFAILNLKGLQLRLPFEAPPSRLQFFVFGFVKQAQGRYRIDAQEFELRPGTIYFTNPGHVRAYRFEAIEESYLITLSEAFLKEHVHAAVFDEFPFLLAETLPAATVTPEVFAEFERLYQQIHHEYLGESPFRQRIIGHLFVALLLKFKQYFWLGYNPIYEGNRSSEIVRRFKLLLERHYRDLSRGAAEQVFRVQDYADAQHLHPNYLSTVIKSKTGKSIGAWIAEKTVAEAKALLLNHELPVKEIAYRLGFAEPAHFSNYFKKHTRLSPAAYRQQGLPPSS